MVFYRKYRSQTIAELDLASVRSKLTNLLRSDEIPHALLFTGPKGLGKTSSARILAKAINCERNGLGSSILGPGKTKNSKPTSKIQHPRSNLEPCNECQVCLSITNGSSMDVIEIDAASNRGIDEIRNLREKVKFAPSQLKKKVYIIDEVHMLTNEAFNALLKTLEEPPDHAMFILCTTEANKLPQTIMSRVFVVQFERPTKEEIRHALDRAVKGEDLQVDEDVFNSIIDLSDGAFRDAHKILEELSYAVADKHITKAVVDEVYKTGTIEALIKSLLEGLAEKDVARSLAAIDSMTQNGADFKAVVENIVEQLRILMIESIEKKSTSKFSLGELKELVEMFNAAYREIPASVLPQLPLELVAIEWTNVSVLDSFTVRDQVAVHVSKESNKSDVTTDTKVETVASSKVSSTRSVAEPQDLLYQIIDEVKKNNQTIAGLLRSCRVAVLDESTLRISTPFQFHRNKLQDKNVLKTIQDVSSQLLNRQMLVEVVMVS